MMKLRQLLSEVEYEYRGQHTAPTRNDAPLHDLTKNGIYPEDVYSGNAIQYYGTGEGDLEVHNIITRCKSRPDMIVTMYRAMPDPSAESKEKIKDINTLIQYVESFGFAPMSNKKIKTYASEDFFVTMRDKYSGEFAYNKNAYLDYLYSERNKLRDNQTAKAKINPGDWVAIRRQYAVDHMAGEKGWTIVSKKVKAKELFTDGNSWDEWGYQP